MGDAQWCKVSDFFSKILVFQGGLVSPQNRLTGNARIGTGETFNNFNKTRTGFGDEPEPSEPEPTTNRNRLNWQSLDGILPEPRLNLKRN